VAYWASFRRVLNAYTTVVNVKLCLGHCTVYDVVLLTLQLTKGVPCTGLGGTFQYSAPRCRKPHDERPAVTRQPPAVDVDPQAHCKEKGDKPDDLQDICPKCNDEIVWVRKRIDVSSSRNSNTFMSRTISHNRSIRPTRLWSSLSLSNTVYR